MLQLCYESEMIGVAHFLRHAVFRERVHAKTHLDSSLLAAGDSVSGPVMGSIL